MESISPEALNERLGGGAHGALLVDARTPEEYAAGHIPGAKNIPLPEIRDAAEHLKHLDTVYVACYSGGRSSQACQILAAEGVRVVNVEGGLMTWEQHGFPVECGA